MKFTDSQPTNGHEVLYLFSKFHKSLGFEKITHISFLWVEAVRNGKPVTVRIRHSSRDFLLDYKVDECHAGSEWVKENGVWIPRNRDGTKGYSMKGSEWSDPDDRFFSDGRYLMLRSMKHIVDVFVCWKIDVDVENGIEVLELSKIPDVKPLDRIIRVLKAGFRQGKHLLFHRNKRRTV